MRDVMVGAAPPGAVVRVPGEKVVTASIEEAMMPGRVLIESEPIKKVQSAGTEHSTKVAKPAAATPGSPIPNHMRRDIEVPPETWTLTQALTCCLLIFTTEEIEDVETKAACPWVQG
ncbi:MAG: hypothetical protein FJX25_17775, partial [Alphaproteobacteria bacterium]|nr:hypothetical protein [Alphaproteobacteria bacterium]